MTSFGYFSKEKTPKWSPSAPPPVWNERRHFKPTDYDVLEKERLAARKFGHVRHQVYTKVTQPPSTSIGYADENERLSTDVDAVIRKDHAKTQSKKKAILEAQTNRRSDRDYKECYDRESEWVIAKKHELWARNEHPHARVIANRTSVPYDPITLQYHDGAEGERARYTDASARWRAAMRSLRIYTKINGDKGFNIVNWAEGPKLDCPEKPTPPFTPKEHHHELE